MIKHTAKLLTYSFYKNVEGISPQTGINLTTKMVRWYPVVEVARFENRICYFDNWTSAQAFLNS